jgi:hypothetical protein
LDFFSRRIQNPEVRIQNKKKQKEFNAFILDSNSWIPRFLFFNKMRKNYLSQVAQKGSDTRRQKFQGMRRT